MSTIFQDKPRLILEPNARFGGKGFQVRVIINNGLCNDVVDENQWSVYEAGEHARYMLDALNQMHGTSYQIYDCLEITQEAIEANQNELVCRKMLHDLQEGTHEFIRPQDEREQKPPNPLYRFIPDEDQTMRIAEDGVLSTFLSMRGTLIAIVTVWKDADTDTSRESVKKLCQIAAARGAEINAPKLLDRLDGLSVEAAVVAAKGLYVDTRITAEDMAEIMPG